MQTYTQNRPMEEIPVRFFVMAVLLCLSTLFRPAIAAEQSIIVLDASGSMWGQIGGKTKMSIARETLHQVLQSMPADNPLGLMVYGHREKGSCSDIELAVPPGVGNADKIAAFVDGINPKGKTPLSAAVQQAAEALKYTEEKATVILVTDGLETCEADPCALASQLEKQGVDFTAHVVGFGLTPEEGKQVACLAENTGGKYFEAADAPQLVAALKETVIEAPRQASEEPQPVPEEQAVAPAFNVEPDAVLSEGGPSLGDNNDVQWKLFPAGADGQPAGDYVDLTYKAHYSVTIPPGKYIGEATLRSLIVQRVPFEVKEGEVAKPFVNFDAATVTLVPKRSADGEADSNAVIEMKFGPYTTTEYGQKTVYISAGTANIKAKIGPSAIEETLTVKAGETLTKELIIGSGIIDNKAIYAEGGPDVESNDLFFEVLSATKSIDGSRKSFGYAYGNGTKLDVPTGEFILKATLGKASGETPFSIGAGERKDVLVNINGGVVAITAPNAYKVVVLEAKKDIQGKQKEITYSFDRQFQDTMPPGDYIVRVTYEGDVAPKEKPVTVKAGERADVTVE